jgi:hypothetical protein
MNELVWLPENRALKGCAVAPRVGKFTKANCAVFHVRYSKEVALKVHKREKFFGSDFEFFTIL